MKPGDGVVGVRVLFPCLLVVQLRGVCVKKIIFIVLVCFTAVVFAEEKATDHAPIGVMADHFHEKGSYMVSVRHSKMFMGGNRNGTKDLSDAEIIQLPNPYQMGSMPAKLSVVPQEMDMDMTMFGMMYAPSDSVTLMGMAMYMGKDMKTHTYKGAMDRAYLGVSNTSSSDLSDVSISALIKLLKTDTSRWHAELGLQQSIGKIDAKDTMLNPMNERKSMLLPYGMQVGDKSTTLVSSLTGVGNRGGWVYGTQLRLKNHINKDVWHFGDSIAATVWLQREFSVDTALSFRTTYRAQNDITGRNTSITAPVQTANPQNYGGKIAELGIGINQLLKVIPGDFSDRVGVEFVVPVYQDLNGPQMKSKWAVTIGYQKAF